jgi:hypothetical protein
MDHMDSRSPNSPASSAAARAKAVPKTKKKPQPLSHTPAPAQIPVNHLFANQAPTISSDSDGSIDDIVFDNTGMRRPPVPALTSFACSSLLLACNTVCKASTLLSNQLPCTCTQIHIHLPSPTPPAAPFTSKHAPTCE